MPMLGGPQVQLLTDLITYNLGTIIVNNQKKAANTDMIISLTAANVSLAAINFELLDDNELLTAIQATVINPVWIAYLAVVQLKNLADIVTNDLKILDNLGLISDLVSANSALTDANTQLTANNVIASEIIVAVNPN